MAKEKKLVEDITSMDVDFAQWYTDVVKKAELIDYTSVKGCMVIKPAGYAIWETIQKELDSAAEGERPCGGLCARGGLGDTWGIRAFAGASVRAANVGDVIL